MTSPTDTDGGAIVSAQTVTGTTSLVYPEIFLYPPSSGAVEVSVDGTGGSKRLDHQLLQTSTYTILMQENGLNTVRSRAA